MSRSPGIHIAHIINGETRIFVVKTTGDPFGEATDFAGLGEAACIKFLERRELVFRSCEGPPNNATSIDCESRAPKYSNFGPSTVQVKTSFFLVPCLQKTEGLETPLSQFVCYCTTSFLLSNQEPD